MRIWLVRLLILALLLSSMTTVAGAQGSGTIEGQVSDSSTDAQPLEGLPVTLWAIRDQEVVDTMTATTDAEGRFLFEDLETEGHEYQFEVEYQGVSYGSEMLTFPEGEDVLTVPFTVFEPTTSDADLWVERAHLIVDFQPPAILVQELQIFVNAGGTTYVGSTAEEGGTTIQFSLPPGAFDVQLGEGLMTCCVVETETGFASDRPIYPGTEQFVFTYALEYQSSDYTFSKQIAYPTNSLDLLVKDLGADVTAPGLTVAEALSIEGGRYLHLTGQNLSPADELTLQITNLPSELPQTTPAPASSTDLGALQWAVVVLAALGVLLAVGYPFFRKRQAEKD